jgi:hypothetical protein
MSEGRIGKNHDKRNGVLIGGGAGLGALIGGIVGGGKGALIGGAAGAGAGTAGAATGKKDIRVSAEHRRRFNWLAQSRFPLGAKFPDGGRFKNVFLMVGIAQGLGRSCRAQRILCVAKCSAGNTRNSRLQHVSFWRLVSKLNHWSKETLDVP